MCQWSALPPPLGLRRPDQIRTMQRIVGVKDDGIWGPKTQEAYEKWSAELQEGSRSSTDETTDRKPRATGSDGWYGRKGKNASEKLAENLNNKLKSLPQLNDFIYTSTESYEGKEALKQIARMALDAGASTAETITIIKGLLVATPAAGAATGGLGAVTTASGGIAALGLSAAGTTSKYSQLIVAIDEYLKNKEFEHTQYSFLNTGTFLDSHLSLYGEVH